MLKSYIETMSFAATGFPSVMLPFAHLACLYLSSLGSTYLLFQERILALMSTCMLQHLKYDNNIVNEQIFRSEYNFIPNKMRKLIRVHVVLFTVFVQTEHNNINKTRPLDDITI